MPEPLRDELYVGYLPVPPTLRAFLRVLVPAALWSFLIVGFVIGRTQPDPGPAVWDQGKPRSFTGVLSAHPYPVLFTEDRGEGTPGPLLLVESGKHGAGPRAAPFDDTRVLATGWLLQRDGRLLLELDPAPDALRAAPGTAPARLPGAVALGPVTLRGEIVDAKCYLGAMKPGDGKTHKECATLCISGGIPPVLVVPGPEHYLLTDPAGGSLSPAVYPFIADPVEIAGELETIGGLRRLRVDPRNIHRAY